MGAHDNVEDDDGVPLSSYYLYDGVGEVPSDVTHVRVAPSVTVIRSNVFGPPPLLQEESPTRRANIRKVILPEGLRCIDERAFCHCTSLTEIFIPPSVEEIGDDAFHHCSQLKEIDLPNSLHCINSRTFAFCESLRYVKILPLISTIYEGAFIGCSNLATVEFCQESSLRKIQSHAFNGCVALTGLILPDQLEEIEPNLFNYCSLVNFRVPSVMTTFNLSVFGDVNSTAQPATSRPVSIEISESIELIEFDSRLSGLRNIALPPGCDIVDPKDLCNVDSLIAVLFPNNDDATVSADDCREMLEMLRRRFDGLSIHNECYSQTFKDNEVVMRNLRRLINPWSTRDSTIIGRLNMTGRMQDCLGMTPLHILACSTRHTLEMYELIVQKHPQNLVTQDKWGDVPLLYAFWCNAPDEIVRFLVESYKTRYPGYTLDWEHMILTLADNKVHTSRIQLLIDIQQQDFANQECNLEDVVARFDCSIYSPRTIEILQFLLREIVSRRIEACGVGRWRIELMTAIDKINDQDLESEIYSMLDQCETLKESAGIIELALWKAKLADDDNNCDKIRKVVNDGTTIGRRERCRINCGADIVLRNVLPYLSPIMN